MTVKPARKARTGAGEAFERIAGPYRREMKLHCYRMMGSLHEAEDLVQEVYLRAWRHFDSFEEGTSIRAWLYRIATNACLNALASRKSTQRWLPDQYGPATAQMPDGKPANEWHGSTHTPTRSSQVLPITRQVLRCAMQPANR
jgi:RNA polymerase sigma-70 factor (ECF subfamily)